MKPLFRELKTLHKLDKFDMNNPAVVEIVLYAAAVLTLLVSRELLELVIEHADDDAGVPTGTLGGDLPVTRLVDPQATQRVPRLLATTAVRANDSRHSENSSTAPDPSRTVHYRHSTNCWS
jgi:hypothetical protein